MRTDFIEEKGKQSFKPFSIFTLASNPGLYFALKTREVLNLNRNNTDVVKSWGLTSVEEDLNKYYPLDPKYIDTKENIVSRSDSNPAFYITEFEEVPRIIRNRTKCIFEDTEPRFVVQRPNMTVKTLRRNYMPKQFVYRGNIGLDYRVANRFRGQFRGPRRFTNILSFNGVWS